MMLLHRLRSEACAAGCFLRCRSSTTHARRRRSVRLGAGGGGRWSGAPLWLGIGTGCGGARRRRCWLHLPPLVLPSWLAAVNVLMNRPELEIGPELSQLREFTAGFPPEMKGGGRPAASHRLLLCPLRCRWHRRPARLLPSWACVAARMLRSEESALAMQRNVITRAHHARSFPCAIRRPGDRQQRLHPLGAQLLLAAAAHHSRGGACAGAGCSCLPGRHHQLRAAASWLGAAACISLFGPTPPMPAHASPCRACIERFPLCCRGCRAGAG